MSFYIALAVLILQASVFGISIQPDEQFEDLVTKFSSRLESLETRDVLLQREIDGLRSELREEKQTTLMMRNIINDLTHRLNNQETERNMFSERPEIMAAIVAKPEVESQNLPETEVTFNDGRTTMTSADIDTNNGDGKAEDVVRTKKGVVDGISPPVEDIGDVAFFANLGNHLMHLGTNQDIAFEQVVTNRGNAYSPHTGAFVAPVPGTYVFSTSLYVQGFNNTRYELVHNSQPVSKIYIRGYDAPFSSSSLTAVLELQQGDVVAVRNVDLDVGLNGNTHSSFAGFLLRMEYSGVMVVGKRNTL